MFRKLIHREVREAEEVSDRTSDIKEVLAMMATFSQFIEEKHPLKIESARVLAL